MLKRVAQIVSCALLVAGCASRDTTQGHVHPLFAGQNPSCRETVGADGELLRICETERHVTVEKVEVSENRTGNPLDIEPKPAPLTGGGVIEKLLEQSIAAKKGHPPGRPSQKVVLVCTF